MNITIFVNLFQNLAAGWEPAALEVLRGDLRFLWQISVQNCQKIKNLKVFSGIRLFSVDFRRREECFECYFQILRKISVRNCKKITNSPKFKFWFLFWHSNPKCLWRMRNFLNIILEFYRLRGCSRN